ncbi:17811_t:CDS:2, partial [Cetraspora pellucida]
LLGQYEKSLIDLNKVLEINQTDEHALVNRGVTYKLLGRYKESLEDLNKVLEIDPNDTFALRSRGEIYRVLEQYNDSLIDLNKALEIDPNDTFALNSRGIIFGILGQYEDSLADLNRALEINPSDTDSLRNRGATYQKLNLFENSLADFNRVLEIDPKDEIALEIIAENHKTECIRLHLESNFNNWTSSNVFIDQLIQVCQARNPRPNTIIEWVPFEKFKNVEYKTKGGFGSIYTAIWTDGWVIEWDNNNKNFIRSGSKEIVLKSLNNSNNPNIGYFKEAMSHIIFSSLGSLGVKCYGLTKSSENSEYMLILKYMKSGNLDSFIFNKHNKFCWKEIYLLLQQILKEITLIHSSNMVHRDLHPGNILSDQDRWFISDLGFCGPADKDPAKQTFGIIPYIAPEVFYFNKYTTASDIYSIGIIMWQLVTRCVPFDGCEHDISLLRNICKGLRPQVISEIPVDYECMMKRCWNANPLQRPNAQELYDYFNKTLEQINNGELLLPDLDFKPSLSQKYLFNNFKSVNFNFKDELSLDDDINEIMHKNNIVRGIVLRELNKYEESIVDFNKSLEVDESSLGYRGITYTMLDQNGKSFTDLKNVNVFLERGITYLHSNRYKESLEDLCKVLEIVPSNTLALVNRAIAYKKLYRYEESIVDLNKALEFEPNNAEILSILLLSTNSPWNVDLYEESVTKSCNFKLELVTQSRALFYEL